MTTTVSSQQPLSELLPTDFKQRICEFVKIKDLAPKWPQVHIARTTDSIATVFKTLIDNFILSVPLLDVTTRKYVAFIDIFDILSYVVEVLNLPIESESWMMSSQFQSTSCIVLPNRSQRNPWQIISEEAPLFSAISVLSQSGAHRLAVIDAQGRFSSVITQSRITRFLANRSMELGELGDKEIRNLPLMSTNLITIYSHERLLDAFLKIYNYNVSCVGVINEDGKIVGNISISDFKDIGFSAGMFQKLFIKCSEFLDRKIEGQDLPKLIWTLPTSTFREVLFKLRVNGIHRVYVVDSEDSMYPEGVITLTDIMNLFGEALKSSPRM